MTRQTITVITDDIDGTPEAETVLFGFDGKQYEIDLNEKNRKRLADALRPFLDKARRADTVSGSQCGRTPRSHRRNNELGDIREWAKSRGHTVSERGRIPASIMDAYNAEQ